VATEAQLQHLYAQLHGVLDLEGSTTMIDIVGPLARNELATRADLVGVRIEMSEIRAEMTSLSTEIRAEMAALGTDLRAQMTTLATDLRAEMGTLATDLRAEMGALRSEVASEIADLKHDLSRTFATWLFLSQGVMVAIVGLLVSLR
jgi:hypothetical protein